VGGAQPSCTYSSRLGSKQACQHARKLLQGGYRYEVKGRSQQEVSKAFGMRGACTLLLSVTPNEPWRALLQLHLCNDVTAAVSPTLSHE
jgi:hypothetical protein